MKLGVFVTDYAQTSDTLDRLGSDVGIIFVQNGVYHATQKQGGKPSPLLSKYSKIHVLGDDLKTRGLAESAVDPKVKVVDYPGLVDVIMKDYEKIIWLT